MLLSSSGLHKTRHPACDGVEWNRTGANGRRSAGREMHQGYTKHGAPEPWGAQTIEEAAENIAIL